MLITLQNPHKIPIKSYRARVLVWARAKIYLSPLGINEQELDNYLQLNYNTTLRAACWDIVQNCTFAKSAEDNVTITLIDRELDKIASVINYGFDGKCGSLILKQIFRI